MQKLLMLLIPTMIWRNKCFKTIPVHQRIYFYHTIEYQRFLLRHSRPPRTWTAEPTVLLSARASTAFGSTNARLLGGTPKTPAPGNASHFETRYFLPGKEESRHAQAQSSCQHLAVGQ